MSFYLAMFAVGSDMKKIWNIPSYCDYECLAQWFWYVLFNVKNTQNVQ